MCPVPNQATKSHWTVFPQTWQNTTGTFEATAFSWWGISHSAVDFLIQYYYADQALKN